MSMSNYVCRYAAQTHLYYGNIRFTTHCRIWENYDHWSSLIINIRKRIMIIDHHWSSTYERELSSLIIIDHQHTKENYHHWSSISSLDVFAIFFSMFPVTKTSQQGPAVLATESAPERPRASRGARRAEIRPRGRGDSCWVVFPTYAETKLPWIYVYIHNYSYI